MKPPLKTCLTIIAFLILFAAAGNHAVAADQDTAPPATNAVAGTDATNAAPATNAEVATNEPAAPAAEMSDTHHRHEDHPTLFSDFVLEKGRTNYGDRVVVKGSTIIDGVLDGNSVTVSGDAKVNGIISGDLVVVLGNCELGPDAQVDGQAVVVGGSLKRDPGAKLQEEPVIIDTGKVPGFRGSVDWITKGLLLGRPLPFGVSLAWIVAGICLLVNLLLLLLFPRPLQACVDTVERQPIGSFFTGILVKLLSGLLIALLIVSVVGIIAVPFVVAALVVAFLFGKITIYRYVGQQLGRQIGLGSMQAPAMALILGTAIFYLLYAVPFLGFVAWGFSGIFGLGAVAIAAIQKFRAEKPKPVSPLPPPPPTPATSSPASTLFANVPGSATPAGENHITAAASAPLSTPNTPASPPSPTPPPLPPVASALEVSLLPRAGFWIRFFALALDFFVFLIPMIIVVNHIHNETAHRIISLLYLLSWLAYHVGLWTSKGTTIGGIITGVKVVRLDGRPLDLPVALIRALASVLSFFVLGLGFFWAGFTRDKQSWHDKIAGTVIVKVPKGMSLI